MTYALIKLLHVFAAILSLGSNLTYFFWMRRAEREPQALSYTLKNIQRMDRRIANPGYLLLLVTGVLMIFLGTIPWTQLWLATSIGLYVGVILIAIVAYAPSFRAQVQMAESFGPGSEQYRHARAKALRFGHLVTLMTLAILALMVLKPGG